jgi:hypothetical protein
MPKNINSNNNNNNMLTKKKKPRIDRDNDKDLRESGCLEVMAAPA